MISLLLNQFLLIKFVFSWSTLKSMHRKKLSQFYFIKTSKKKQARKINKIKVYKINWNMNRLKFLGRTQIESRVDSLWKNPVENLTVQIPTPSKNPQWPWRKEFSKLHIIFINKGKSPKSQSEFFDVVVVH